MIDRRIASLVTVLALAACTDFPALDAAVSRRPDPGPAPDLLPIDTLLSATAGARLDASDGAALAARAERLRARAALMRGPVLDPETRARLAAAIAAGRA
jgi:hypothetical protein